MTLQESIRLAALKRRAALTLPISDAAIEEAEASGLKLVQMSAKVSPELVVALDNVCKTLDLVKREFIEGAVADAIKFAEAEIATIEAEIEARIEGGR